MDRLCRSPHGECGLKSFVLSIWLSAIVSLPAWGVWIEIHSPSPFNLFVSSLPAWGVWIEMINSPCDRPYPLVAPRMGSVD